jgi:hypothetical protein
MPQARTMRRPSALEWAIQSDKLYENYCYLDEQLQTVAEKVSEQLDKLLSRARVELYAGFLFDAQKYEEYMMRGEDKPRYQKHKRTARKI